MTTLVDWRHSAYALLLLTAVSAPPIERSTPNAQSPNPGPDPAVLISTAVGGDDAAYRAIPVGSRWTMARIPQEEMP